MPGLLPVRPDNKYLRFRDPAIRPPASAHRVFDCRQYSPDSGADGESRGIGYAGRCDDGPEQPVWPGQVLSQSDGSGRQTPDRRRPAHQES